jgi:iron complex transport system ATP-binding protein
MSDIYKLESINFSYQHQGDFKINNLNLTIKEGSITTLLGPNGSGKSTLMNLLLKWLKPTSGLITLLDKPLSSYNQKELGQLVALVPQSETFRFAFSVTEYILLGRFSHLKALESPTTKDLDIAYEAMESVGITKLANREITNLSGGEHQLVLLARSLAQNPKVLLLDEPTSSLDPANTAVVIKILKELSKKGITLFFTTHDPMVSARCATDVVMINKGKLLFAGETKEALTSQLLTKLYNCPMESLIYNGEIVVVPSF